MPKAAQSTQRQPENRVLAFQAAFAALFGALLLAGQLLGGAPEAAFALGERGEGFLHFGLVEVGPQYGCEIKFGVCHLPEHKVADAGFAACADKEVGLGGFGEHQAAGEVGFADVGFAFGDECVGGL